MYPFHNQPESAQMDIQIHTALLSGVISAYITAVYFTDTGEEGQPEGSIELAEETVFKVAEEVADFMRQCAERGLLDQYRQTGRTWDSFGHDIWFTRNGHGCGFWDRGKGSLWSELDALAKALGERSLVEGDDGKGYLE